jgi:hypothetical protein
MQNTSVHGLDTYPAHILFLGNYPSDPLGRTGLTRSRYVSLKHVLGLEHLEVSISIIFKDTKTPLGCISGGIIDFRGLLRGANLLLMTRFRTANSLLLY